MLIALMIIFGICLLLTAITEMSINGFLFLAGLFIFGIIIEKIVDKKKDVYESKRDDEIINRNFDK